MSKLFDARAAVFAPGPLDKPPGFDPTYVVPSILHAMSLISVQWTSDPALGLPTQPFEVLVANYSSAKNLETSIPDTTLDKGNSFRLFTGNITPPERTLYIRGIVDHADQDAMVFALDASGHHIEETAQFARPGEPILIFGPTLAGIAADRAVRLTKIHVGAVRNDFEWYQRIEVAPAIASPIYDQVVEGLGPRDAKTAALWRLNGNTFARMCGTAPTHKSLRDHVHLEDIVSAAQEFQNARPFIEIEQNLNAVLLDPEWSYIEQLPDGASTIDVTVQPVALLQLLKSLGPIEASTFGYAVTAGVERAPVLSRREAFDALEKGAVPFPIVKVIGHFRLMGVEAYARLAFVDQPVAPSGSSQELQEPVSRDAPATADADITLKYGGWLETYFLERDLELAGKPDVVFDLRLGTPKLFGPRAVLKDGSDAIHPWFSDAGLDVADTDNPVVRHDIYRRDEFGRWPERLEADTDLPPFPIQPPGVIAVELRYDANANVDLELAISRSWKLRTPLDLRVAFAIGNDVSDSPLANLSPEDGVSSPAIGNHKDLRIRFDADGAPTIQFSGTAGNPQVIADQFDDGTGLPDERSYTLRIRLGSAVDIFGVTADRKVLAVTADASNARGGVTRRSAAAPRQVRNLLDPRPPVLVSTPWQVVWSSRPNPQNRVRVTVAPAQASAGSLKGFRIWQATETALIDFALEQAGTPTEKAEIHELASLLKRTTSIPVRAQLLRNRISPILSTSGRRAAFFSKFDAISEQVWPPERPVDLELSSRHDGPIVLLLTGVSKTNVETIDILNADLRAVAVPDRVPDPKPVVQVIANLDPLGATPNACLLVVGSNQAFDQRTVRVFWDTGDEFENEEELLHHLSPSSCFPLTVTEARPYLHDVDTLIQRMETPHYAIFLLFLPQTWGYHYLTADILNPSPNNPAEEIPSRRATFVHCFIRPGSSPELILDSKKHNSNVVEWKIGYSGLPPAPPPGHPPSGIYLETTDGAAKAGPTPLMDVLQNGLNLSFGGTTVHLADAGDATFEVTASGWSSGTVLRLMAADPTSRQAVLLLV